MIESEAEVIRVEGDHAWVRIRPHTPCGNCDPETGCKTVAMTRMFSGKKQEFRVRNPLVAAKGDLVRVAIADGVLLQSALWGYGLPLAALMTGAALGHFLFPAPFTDFASLAGAGAGVVIAMLLSRRRANLAEPEIVEKQMSGMPKISSCKNNVL